MFFFWKKNLHFFLPHLIPNVSFLFRNRCRNNREKVIFGFHKSPVQPRILRPLSTSREEKSSQDFFFSIILIIFLLSRKKSGRESLLVVKVELEARFHLQTTPSTWDCVHCPVWKEIALQEILKMASKLLLAGWLSISSVWVVIRRNIWRYEIYFIHDDLRAAVAQVVCTVMCTVIGIIIHSLTELSPPPPDQFQLILCPTVSLSVTLKCSYEMKLCTKVECRLKQFIPW